MVIYANAHALSYLSHVVYCTKCLLVPSGPAMRLVKLVIKGDMEAGLAAMRALILVAAAVPEPVGSTGWRVSTGMRRCSTVMWVL